MNLGLGCRVQILELVYRLELDDVEPIGYDPVWLAFQQVFRLVRRDVRHGREHV